MATYTELFDLRTNTALRNKVAVAVVVKAQALISGATPTAGQIAWASAAISGPLAKADDLLNVILAANKALTTSQITAASDSAIQTQVDSAVDALIAGGIV